jgi:phenylacetate-CoA ligase
MSRMAAEIADWAPVFLDTDPAHAAWFALYCERNGIRFPSLKFILCSYEFVSVVHRRILERVFGVPVFNLYGSTETGHLLMENELGKMMPCYENAYLEVVEPDSRNIGDLVVTTLTNDYMPLLRYRIGDLAERCALSYGTNYIVHGRARDALRAPDGHRVTTWDVDQCFNGLGGIAHYQLAQSADGSCRLRYVSDANAGGPQSDSLKTLVSRLEALLQTPVEVESVDMLPPTPSGKFRLTVGATGG